MGESLQEIKGVAYPSWRVIAQNKAETYAYINCGEAVCPKEVVGRSIVINLVHLEKSVLGMMFLYMVNHSNHSNQKVDKNG